MRDDGSPAVAEDVVPKEPVAVVTPIQIALEDRPAERRYLRLLIEGVAIVASVLLGFGIQAWWEERQERAEEVRLLAATTEEFISNLEALERNRRFHRAVASTDSALLRLAGAVMH